MERNDRYLLRREIKLLKRNGRFDELKKYIAHSNVTVYTHCIHVAALSLILVNNLHIKVDTLSLVRGALLHDYYLYDWHEPHHGLHGFSHPQIAADNAALDFDIIPKEVNIISSHMFPLTIRKIPKSKEAWIVTIADKVVATWETIVL